MVIVLWSDKNVSKYFIEQNILTLHILVVGWPWPAARCSRSRSLLPLLGRTGGRE